MHVALIFILCLLVKMVISDLSFKIISTTNKAGQTTDHIVQIFLKNQNIIAGSRIKIEYSSLWGLTSISGRNLATDFCQNSCNLGSVSVVVASPNVQLLNLFPNTISSQFVIQYTLKNIKNPFYADKYTILMELSDNTNMFQNLNVYQLEIQSTDFVCSLSRNIVEVSELSQYSITIDVSSSGLTIPANGYLLMNFPTLWSNSAAGTTYSTGTSLCTSVLNPAISCTVINQRVVQASNILTLATNSQISYKISNIKNPGSIQTNNQLYIVVYGNSKAMGKCPITIAASTPKVLANLAFSTVKSKLSQNSAAIIYFELPVEPKISDSVRISIPLQYKIKNLNLGTKTLNDESSTQGVQIFMRSSSSTHNLIQLFPFSIQTIANYTLTFYDLNIPLASQLLGQLSVGLYRNGFLVASNTCCQKTYAIIEQGSLSIQLQQSTIGVQTAYQISITGIFVTTYSFIKLTFDPSYQLSSSPTYQCSMINIQQIISPICSMLTSNTILISNIALISNLQLTNTYTIQLIDIPNPISLSQLTLTLQTLDSDSNPIQSIEGTYTLIGTKISSVVIVVKNSVTLQLSQYQFLINNTNQLPVNAIIVIKLPVETPLTATTQCYVSSSVVNTATIDINGRTVTIPLNNGVIVNANQLQNINVTVSDVRNPATTKNTNTFQVQLNNGVNILQQKKQGVIASVNTLTNAFNSLTITLSTSLSYTSSEITIDITLPSDIQTIYPSVYNTAYIQLTLPSNFQLLSCPSCLSLSPLTATINISPLPQTINQITIRNPYQVTITNSITVALYIDGYLSVSHQYSSLNSFIPHDITFTLQSGNTYLNQQSYQQFNITQNIPEDVSYVRVVVPNQYSIGGSGIEINIDYHAGTVTPSISGLILNNIQISNIPFLASLTITVIGLVNPISSPGSISWIIQFYSTNDILIAKSTATNIFTAECTFPCRSCSLATPTQCLTCYNISGSSNPKLNLQTCTVTCYTNQFQISNICYNCLPECETCASLQNNCTQCPINTYLYNNTCVVVCPLLYYEDTSLKLCIRCVSPCLLCSNTTCFLCQTGNVLTAAGTCAAVCPSQYFNKSNTCQKCQINCTVCDNTGCQTCVNNTYLYQGVCVINCPRTLYISGVLQCQNCQSPCLTCSVNSDNCTSCNPISANAYLDINNCVNSCPIGQYFDQNLKCKGCISPCNQCTSPTTCVDCVINHYYYAKTKQCFLNCPTNTIQIGSQCYQCTSPCLECSVAVNTCTSCIEAYFLDGNRCNSTCNPPYYAIDRECTRCARPCDTCANNLPYSCLTCISGYYFLGSSCYATCPPGTLSSGSSCTVCTSGCKQCQVTSSTCLSCVSGLFLYLSACISSCPTSPTLYYQYQSQCIACQPECSSCLSTPVQCSTCSSASLYFNPETRACTVTCSDPYFSQVVSSVNTCVRCTAPCRTCTTTSSTCQTCLNNHYLYIQQCLQVCPLNFYEQLATNQCHLCSTNCIQCQESQVCDLCSNNYKIFKGVCYDSCPPQAQYEYLNKYCRNCEKDHCLMCNDDNQCILCEDSYYSYENQCLEQCPTGYQPDQVTQSMCTTTQQTALLTFIRYQQRYKVYMLPGFIIFLFSLLILLFDSWSRLYLLMVLLAFPQFIAYITYAIYLIMHPQLYLSFIPIYLPLICLCWFIIMNVIHTIFICVQLSKDSIFLQWKQYSKTSQRYTILLIFAAICNNKIFYLLFSGFSRIPITSCQISALAIDTIIKRLRIMHGVSLFFVEFLLLCFTIYAIIVEKYYLTNYRLLFTSVDVILISLISLVVTLIFITHRFRLPPPYRKYIIEKISNLSLPALSEKLPDLQPEQLQDSNNKLHRSNSAEMLKKRSQEMDKIQYLSAFDTNQFEDPPFFDDVDEAIQAGKYRKKNLKKKKNRFNLGLDIIEEQSELQQEKIQLKVKKKKSQKKRKIGYLNNFIYWKPTEAKQKTVQQKVDKQIKMHEKQIMEKLKEKQSEFDTLTKNDLIFQQEPLIDGYSSYDSDDYGVQDSRRALNFQYEAFMNKNYAQKKHLDFEDI